MKENVMKAHRILCVSINFHGIALYSKFIIIMIASEQEDCESCALLFDAREAFSNTQK